MCSRSNWILEALIFEEMVQPKCRKNISRSKLENQQQTRPVWRRGRELNRGETGWEASAGENSCQYL